jgi:hypothetical protein
VTVVFDVPVTVATKSCSALRFTVTAVTFKLMLTFVGELLQPNGMAAHTKLSANQNLRDFMIAVPPTLFMRCMPPLAAVSFFRISSWPPIRRSC